jgi:glycosyltransferase involved in cell wall biosynthesis
MNISIIIAIYNDTRFLRETLESTIGKGEVIISNDGSTAEATAVIKSFAGEYGTKYVEHEHLGLSSARNAGIEIASNEVLLPLDADDNLLIIPDLSPLEDKSIGVLYGNYMDQDGKRHYPQVGFSLDALLSNCQLFASSYFTKTVWNAVGRYRKEAWCAEDWDLWGRIMKRGYQFRYIDRDVYMHRIRPDSKENIEIREGRNQRGLEEIRKYLQSI